MRVFSGMTRTRPQRFTSLANSRNSLTAWGVLPARCSRKVYREQKCDWFRFANDRLQLGHCHSRSARMTKECTVDCSSRGGYSGVMRTTGWCPDHHPGVAVVSIDASALRVLIGSTVAE